MYWFSLTPTKEGVQAIQNLRDTVHSRVDGTTYEIEDDPHFTIVPGFTSEQTPTVDAFPTKTPITVRFDSYYVWPNTDTPMVVALRPSDTSELESLRITAAGYVSTVGKLEYGPTPFHLTLFKGGDSGDEKTFTASPVDKSSIASLVKEKPGLPLSVTFDTLSVSTWDA